MSMQERELVHPDIRPENPPQRAAHYLDVPNMPWEPTKFPGIKIKVLYTDDTGITTALFKLEPGAVVPLHEHTALEQTYVIEGSLEDHEGKCGAGQFVWRPAGNQHEAVASNGAVLLGFFLKPNRFAYGEKFFTAPGAVERLLINVPQYRLLPMHLADKPKSAVMREDAIAVSTLDSGARYGPPRRPR
jgi:quercetin dioxygenase-like cupin family protein